jgi:K+-transporting ATPase ATPase A chain
MLGTNGGGFFNANSAHPFENPTPLSNFLQMLAIFLIPAALCFTFGRMVGDTARAGPCWRDDAAVRAFAIGAMHFEQQGNPGSRRSASTRRKRMAAAGGNMEGKEARFGIADSALFAAITTAASCGAVNSMHDSYTPLGGMVPMVLMQLGEVVFGGVGSGLYGMLVFALLAVFIAGLMIGRTPEYLGKKIEALRDEDGVDRHPRHAAAGAGGTAIAVMTDAGRAGIANPGTHGFSEMLYAFTSAGNNNGSAFAGLSANTPFYNVLLAHRDVVRPLWRDRAGAGHRRLAGRQEAHRRHAGTLPTHGPLFVILLIGTVLLVGAAELRARAGAWDPVVEHLTIAQRDD